MLIMRMPDNPEHRVLVMPWDKPPLSLNDRYHTMQEARIISAIRDIVHVQAHRAGLPRDLPHVWVEMVWRAPDLRRRDSDNLVGTMKHACDALAKGTKKVRGYGMVKDDTPDMMTKIMPVILTPTDPRMPSLPVGATAIIVTWEGTPS